MAAGPPVPLPSAALAALQSGSTTFGSLRRKAAGANAAQNAEASERMGQAQTALLNFLNSKTGTFGVRALPAAAAVCVFLCDAALTISP